MDHSAYNKLIGFDHIFMFYRPEVANLDRFEELQSLPYVTLTEQMTGTRSNYYNQDKTDEMCIGQENYAASFDWVFIVSLLCTFHMPFISVTTNYH